VAVALAACVAGIANGFAQDDVRLILGNPAIQRLANLPALFAAPYWPPPAADLYRPLTAVLLALEYAVSPGPLLFRMVSYLLYAAAAVAVFRLGRRLLPRGIALGAALLFAAHPVHVEAVAPAVNQSELLVGLLAVLMAIRYLDRRRAGAGLLSRRDWLWLGALYVAAGLSKENGLVLPGLLLGAELFLFAGPARDRLKSLAPGYALLGLLGLLMVLARTAVLSGYLAVPAPAEALDGLSAAGRGLLMLKVVPQWARLLLWPAHLQVDYGPQELMPSDHVGPAEALGALLLLGIVAAAWMTRRRAPAVGFGLVWCAVALLPVSNVVIPTGIVLAERTLLLPSIGFVIAVGGVVALLLGAATGRVWLPRALVAGCAVLVTAGVLRSAERQGVWRNDTVLAIRAAEEAPLSYRMQTASGFALFKLGAREQAAQAYERALALAPPKHLWRVRNDIARRYWEAGKDSLAVAQLEQSLEEAPDQEETRSYLVLGYLALGDYAEAARQADVALARGGKPAEFRELRALADSAARAGAPPGSVKVRVVPGFNPP